MVGNAHPTRILSESTNSEFQILEQIKDFIVYTCSISVCSEISEFVVHKSSIDSL